MDETNARPSREAPQQPQPGMSAHRSRPMFVNLKSRLHLPGVNELLEPCTQHLTASQYKRMLTAWQSMERYHVFGFVLHGRVIGMLSLEESAPGACRLLTIAVQPNQQGRGLGRRLVVESFCSLNLKELIAKSLDEGLGFYQKLNFKVQAAERNGNGREVHTCLLDRPSLHSSYAHEYSAGAVLFTQKDEQRLYVLVTELSGNTGLPKGHVEEGESEEETALREIHEETGLKARLLPGFGGEIVYPQGRGMLKHFTYFLATYDADDEPQSGTDVTALALPYEQALRKLSFADVRTILRKAETFLNDNIVSELV